MVGESWVLEEGIVKKNLKRAVSYLFVVTSRKIKLGQAKLVYTVAPAFLIDLRKELK